MKKRYCHIQLFGNRWPQLNGNRKNIKKALGKVKKKEIAFPFQHLTQSTTLSGASSFKSMVVTIYNNQDKEAT